MDCYYTHVSATRPSIDAQMVRIRRGAAEIVVEAELREHDPSLMLRPMPIVVTKQDLPEVHGRDAVDEDLHGLRPVVDHVLPYDEDAGDVVGPVLARVEQHATDRGVDDRAGDSTILQCVIERALVDRRAASGAPGFC